MVTTAKAGDPQDEKMMVDTEPAVPDFSFIRFCRSRPFLLTGILSLFCLWIQQEYRAVLGDKYATSENVGLSGTVVPINAVSIIAAAVCLVWIWTVFIGSIREKAWKKALYISAGISIVFLVGRLLLNGGETVTDLLCVASVLALSFINVFFAIKRKNASAYSMFAFCALLLLVPLVGAGVALYYIAAVGVAVFVFFSCKELRKLRRILAAAIPVLSAVAAHFVYADGDTPLNALLASLLLLCLGALLLIVAAKRVRAGYVIAIMFTAGFIMRLGYVLDITLPHNQHDVFPLTSEYPRHNSYIWHIFENWSLPQEDVYNAGLSQYYHPPLHHLLSALWMKLQTYLGIDAYAAYENVQYFTLFCSSAMMVAANKLFKEFNLKGTTRVIAFAVIAFHPTFYIFAGSINNDCLCTLFLFLAVLYTVRWYKDQSYKNTLMLALFIGGAMMTKLSGAMVAVGTAYVILAVLFNLKTGVAQNFRRLWKKGLLFAAVCFPLGLWWPLRCKILYGMPLGYVPSMTQSQANPQYVAEYSFWERLTGAGSQHFSNVFPTIGGTDFYGNTGVSAYDYGIAPYSVKSSLFGEYFSLRTVGAEGDVLAHIMFFTALVLILFTFAGLVCSIWASLMRDKQGNLRSNCFITERQSVPVRFLFLYYAALMGSYVMFCFRYPFTCTMDFRYIVPALLTGCVFTGIFLNGNTKWQKVMTAVVGAVTMVFCLASAMFYYLSYSAPQ